MRSVLLDLQIVYPMTDQSSSIPLILRTEISFDSGPYDSDARAVFVAGVTDRCAGAHDSTRRGDLTGLRQAVIAVA